MHIKINNKLFLFAFRKDIKINKWIFKPNGIFSQRTIIRIPFFQIDIFYLLKQNCFLLNVFSLLKLNYLLVH